MSTDPRAADPLVGLALLALVVFALLSVLAGTGATADPATTLSEVLR